MSLTPGNLPRRNILLYLTAIAMVGFTIDGGIYSVVYNLYLLRLGYEADFIGLIASISLAAFTLVSAPAGLLGGRLGARRVMLVGMGAMLLSTLLMPLVSLAPESYRSAWLTGLFSIQLIGLAAFFVNGPPYLTAVTPPSMRETAFSYQVALWSFAAFVGSLLGGFLPGALAAPLGLTLAEPTPYAYPLGLAAVGVAVGFVALLVADDAAAVSHPSEAKAVSGPAFPVIIILVLGLVRFFHAGAIGATVPFFNVYLDSGLQVPTATIGIVTAFGRLLAAPAALLTPILARRWGNANLVTWGSLLLSVLVLPMIFMPEWVAVSAGFVGLLSVSAIRYAAFLVYAMDIVPPQRRGLLSGVSETSAGVSFALTALIGGQMITHFGYPLLFSLGSVLGLVGTAIFWAYFQARRRVPLPVVDVGEG